MNSSRRVFPIILLLSHALSMATAFCTQRALVARRNSYWQISPLSQNTNNNIDEDEDDDDDDDNYNDSDINENYPRETRNKMEQFIAAFLDKQEEEEEEDNSDGINEQVFHSPTHLIAMPIHACDELVLALESVQRAILYHAPILVHACLAPATFKLPLLYVQAKSKRQRLVVKDELAQILQDTMEEHFFRQTTTDNDNNEQGHTPLFLDFATLDIEGDRNARLSTVVVEPTQSLAVNGEDGYIFSGYARLQNFLQALQATLQQAGYATQLAINNQNHHKNEFRLPFMRLPDNWNTLIYNTTDEDVIDSVFVSSDQGGNGISPILWGEWMDDVFAKHVRMRQVAIYSRTDQELQLRRRSPNEAATNESSTTSADEQAFYLPERLFELPEGNALLARKEKEFQVYQEKRLKEAEAALERELRGEDDDDDYVESDSDNNMIAQLKDDPLFTMTRKRLEQVYEQDNKVNGMTIADAEILSKDTPTNGNTENDDDSDDGTSAEDTADILATNRPVRPENPDAINDWTRIRIRNIIDARARLQEERKVIKKKDLPPIHENPVLKKFREGTLAPKQPPPPTPKPLPPYPSREHVVGFWKVIQSPTGFDIEEKENQSENLVLRVDGTIAGGPTLDQETRQKASGGTWKLILGESPEDAKVRIRLVIPPKKERILVMEGKLDRFARSLPPMAGNTFGIPLLEEKMKQTKSNPQDNSLHCSGTVHLEDSITGANRVDIGGFFLTKLDVLMDPSQFTITVPRPAGYND